MSRGRRKTLYFVVLFGGSFGQVFPPYADNCNIWHGQLTFLAIYYLKQETILIFSVISMKYLHLHICFLLFNYRKLLDHHSVTDVAQVPKQLCVTFVLYLALHDFSISCSCSCCLCHSVFSSLHKLPKLVTFENRCRNASQNFLLTHGDMQGLKSLEATHGTCLASC